MRVRRQVSLSLMCARRRSAPTTRHSTSASRSAAERAAARLNQIEESETAGIIRMSHGLLFAATPMFHVQEFMDNEMHELFLEDKCAPARSAALKSLAAFTSSLLFCRPPSSPKALTTRIRSN